MEWSQIKFFLNTEFTLLETLYFKNPLDWDITYI